MRDFGVAAAPLPGEFSGLAALGGPLLLKGDSLRA